MLADTGYMESTGEGVNIDPDFEDFFADFSEKDVSSSIITWEDFGFTFEGELDWSGAVTMSEDQEAAFLERLRQREARLEQQAILEQQDPLEGSGSN